MTSRRQIKQSRERTTGEKIVGEEESSNDGRDVEEQQQATRTRGGGGGGAGRVPSSSLLECLSQTRKIAESYQTRSNSLYCELHHDDYPDCLFILFLFYDDGKYQRNK